MSNIHKIENFQYAGFWYRLFATLIDGILISFFVYLLIISGVPFTWAYTLWTYFLAEGEWDGSYLYEFGENVWLFIIIIYIMVSIVFCFSFWIWKKSTPGKMAIHAKILDARTGKSPSLIQYVIRYISFLISAIPVFIGFLWIAFDTKKQGWHDKLARTVVVKLSNPTAKVKFSDKKEGNEST